MAPSVSYGRPTEETKSGESAAGEQAQSAGIDHVEQSAGAADQAALAQVVSDLARDLRPDPEDALAQWVGDVPARRLVAGAQGAFAAAQSFARNLTQNVAEYLAEESNTLAGTPALASLAQEGVRALTRLEQLEQRQAALQARLAGLTPRSGSPA